MPGHLTKAIVNQWATDAYMAGYQAAMDGSGTGGIPTDIDVSIFDPRKNGETSQITKRGKINAEERSHLEYDPCKCDARVWNEGFGAQCSRKKVDGEILCVSCLKKHEDLESKGLNLPFGLITDERPTISLDKGAEIAWKDLKKDNSSSSKKSSQKMPKVGEMREFLDSRGTSHDGCKKKEVFELYQEQKKLEALETSHETLESSHETLESSNDSSNEVVENPLSLESVDSLDVSSDNNDEEKPKKKSKKKKKGKKGKKKQESLDISEEDAKAKIELAKAAAEKAAAEKAAAEKAAAEKAAAEKAAAEKAAAEKAAAEALLLEEEVDSEAEDSDSGEETEDMSDNEDNSDDSDDDLDEDETEAITYQGVDYFLQVSSDKVIDPKGKHVGSWSAGRRSITWNTDEDLEAHQKLVE